ncbi:MAG: hypothetical protein HY465_05405 [Deltaproteobacteria bacterium]|nr:hypothetical protein [Deltaproteobacteria bacterium]
MKNVLVCIIFFTALRASAAPESLIDLDVETFEQQTMSTTPAGVKDPFSGRTGGDAKLTVDDLSLSATAVGDEASFALISGHVVRVGDRIAGCRVQSIESDRVVLKRFDDTIVLQVGGGS